MKRRLKVVLRALIRLVKCVYISIPSGTRYACPDKPTVIPKPPKKEQTGWYCPYCDKDFLLSIGIKSGCPKCRGALLVK